MSRSPGQFEVEWDEDKNKYNRKAHRVSFEEAATVFYDELAITIDDPDHSIDERRFLIVGESRAGHTLVVSYAEGSNRIRLISARKPTRKERKSYEESD
ncbi:MAG: BrnT family toxin [Pyrinomonadaceae bacterium]